MLMGALRGVLPLCNWLSQQSEEPSLASLFSSDKPKGGGGGFYMGLGACGPF